MFLCLTSAGIQSLSALCPLCQTCIGFQGQGGVVVTTTGAGFSSVPSFPVFVFVFLFLVFLVFWATFVFILHLWLTAALSATLFVTKLKNTDAVFKTCLYVILNKYLIDYGNIGLLECTISA